MNICLLNDSFPPVIDGVANAVQNYADVLKTKIGADVIVGTPRYPDADYSNYPYRVIDYPSVDLFGLVSGYRAGNSYSIKEINEMASFLPDIIHTHCPASSTLMARILQYETGAPIVFTYHTKFDVDISRAVGDGFLKKEAIYAMVKNISACDEIWTVSKGAGDNLRSLGFEGNIRVMNNGVDFERGLSSDAEVKKVSNDYNLNEDMVVFLYVGRMVKYKGLPLILEALKKLSDTGADFKMLMVGGGPDLDELKTVTKELCLDDKVIFTGPVYDREYLRAINTRADLFLFPSTYDTNGIVVREAAACGLSSVLIKDSCASEGVTDQRNGFLIDEDPDSMFNLLASLINNRELMRTAGINAMNELYISWEDSVKCAYSRYEELRQMLVDGTLRRRKKHKSDILIEFTTDVAETLYKAFSIPKDFYEGMMDNVFELKDEIKEFIPESARALKNKIKEKITG